MAVFISTDCSTRRCRKPLFFALPTKRENPDFVWKSGFCNFLFLFNVVPPEMQQYQKAKKEYNKKKYAGRVLFIETNPCTEFWFLLHFLPNMVCRRYESYDQLLPELQKYMPGYEKTKRYFIRTNLYKYLTENGDLERAMSNSEKLCQLCHDSPEDLKAYSEIHEVIELLNKSKFSY